MTAKKPSAATPGKQVAAGDHVYLIDASGYLFRAYHALPPLTRPSDGIPVGAVHGFCGMLWKLLRETGETDPPTHLAAIFDLSEHTFRNELYPDYKANRSETPEDLIPQFPLVRDAVRAYPGLPEANGVSPTRAGPMPSPLMMELDGKDTSLSFYTAFTTFALPSALKPRSVKIEWLYPADRATARTVHDIAASP